MTTALMEVPKTVFQRDWAAMSAAEQRSFFSKNGFLVIPKVFSPEEIKTMHKEIEQLDLENQKLDMCDAFCSAPSFAAMVDSPKILSALSNIIGSNLVCIKGCYVAKKSKQGSSTPHRTALHVDYGIFERDGDYRASSPSYSARGISWAGGCGVKH